MFVNAPYPQSSHFHYYLIHVYYDSFCQAQEAFKEHLELTNKSESSPEKINNGTFNQLAELNFIQSKLLIQNIVFAALSMEAYINLLGKLHLPINEFNNEFEHMDLVEKWKLIPKAIFDYGIDTKRSSYKTLIELKKARHKVVHAKSEAVNSTNLENLFIKEPAIIDIKNMIDDLFDQLQAIDPDRSYKIMLPWTPGYAGFSSKYIYHATNNKK